MHVMKPEFTAQAAMAPHQAVACAECHIAPGATGFLQAKMNGTHQLIGVLLNNYPRPIESAMENNKLVSSAETCEQCHTREKTICAATVLLMHIGGGTVAGIHGAHLGPAVAAADKKRQTIPWLEYTNTQGGVSRSYLAMGTTTDAVRSLPIFEMQCVDCHNRASHAFETPDRAVNQARANGQIAATLPYIKKQSLALLQKCSDAAVKRGAAIQAAGQALAAIYQRNVFPDLKVAWGTYRNNLGHTDDPGCLHFHDEAHLAADKKTITQDCSTCHQAVAMDEPSPDILKTLELTSTKNQ